MERNIPHVRDIFAPYRATPSNKSQEVFVYEHSPGSRRRRLDAFQDYMDADRTPPSPLPQPTTKEASRRNNSHHRNSQNERPLTEKERNAANKSQDKSNYSSKTLTDRDIRHLERHLSMKKTIRKQISRNLAQAFVEDPQQVLDSEGHVQPTVTAPLPPSQLRTNDNYTFTLTRAKMARSDTPAFLEMLKDGNQKPLEADSGHSSPSHHQDDSDLDFDEKIIAVHHAAPPTNNERLNNDVKRPTSFWKKLGFKGKSKR